jgi:squalene-hopene/tetraprenyl-beta-curcumene cyclase
MLPLVGQRFYEWAALPVSTSSRQSDHAVETTAARFTESSATDKPIMTALALASLSKDQQRASEPAPSPASQSFALASLHKALDVAITTADWWTSGVILTCLAKADLGTSIVGSGVRAIATHANSNGSWSFPPLDSGWWLAAVNGLLEAGYAGHARFRPTLKLLLRAGKDRPWPVTHASAELVSTLCQLPGVKQTAFIGKGVEVLSDRQDIAGCWSVSGLESEGSVSKPCPYTTAQAMTALLDTGVSLDDDRIQRAVRWLTANQQSDGSFTSVCYRPHTAATAAAVRALIKSGLANHQTTSDAIRWLKHAQRDDGSWSTGDRTLPGTVEETAWSICSLLDIGTAGGNDIIQRGIEWLLNAYHQDAVWVPAAVGLFPLAPSWSHNSALVNGLAIRALAKFRAAIADREGTANSASEMT